MHTDALRNIGIIAHIDAGKTTFSERVLYYSHVIHRMGEVHEGAATMDFLPEEQERGITIASACISCQWNDHQINLVDTPGHVDFTIEVERCLRVLDAAVGIFCAVAGVEPQSETVWKQADAFGIPRLAVINKMDRAGANFADTLLAMEMRLGVRPVALVIPVGEGESFCAVLDIITEQRLLFDASTQGATVTRIPYSADDAKLAAPYKEQLLDMLTETDDALLEMVLAGEKPSVEQIEASVRRAVIDRHFVPVFAASALRNIGVQPVMGAICKYLPSPHDVPAVVAHPMNTTELELAQNEVLVPCNATGPFCALVFKVIVEHSHKIVFLRIYSGKLTENDMVLNTTNGLSMRVQKLYRLLADQKEIVPCAEAGDIIAVKGLKDVVTGDTLAAKDFSVRLEPIRTLNPVISLAFESRNSEEGEQLDEILALIAAEDPTLFVRFEPTTGQRIVSGMGELHLDVVCERIRREFSLTPRVGNPQVVRHETIEHKAEATAEFDKELGEQPQYGKVTLTVTPGKRGIGVSVTFAEGTAGVGNDLLQAAHGGIMSGISAGPSGFVVDDVAICIEAIDKKDGKATHAGVHLAAQHALLAALTSGVSVVLEPLMQVVVTVPDDFLGPVMSLLGARGTRVEKLEDKGGGAHAKDVFAVAPMQQLFGFATSLRSVSQGRAGVAMQFLRFDTATSK